MVALIDIIIFVCKHKEKGIIMKDELFWNFAFSKVCFFRILHLTLSMKFCWVAF